VSNPANSGVIKVVFPPTYPPEGPFISIAAFKTWLAAQPNNTADSPYTAQLQDISDLGGDSNTAGSLGYVLRDNNNKYVSIVFLGKTITSIQDNAFFGCTNLSDITIPNVNSIGRWAFANCTSLRSVSIPDSVKSIGDSAFQWCTGLTSVTIGNGVTRIGVWAFAGCTSLTNVNIGNNVASIGDSAFRSCSNLSSITIGRGAVNIRIEDYSFYECTNLTSLILGQRVTLIENYVFIGCSNLSRVTFDGEIGSIYNNAFPGDLYEAYLKGGRGTYTIANNWYWTKQ